MEKTGIRIEPGYLEEISRHMAGELQRLEGEIYAAAGTEFNIGSPPQLGEILFERLGLRIVSRTSKGQASTKESVLQELATEHPLPGLILDWRQISKLKSTYVDSLGALAHPDTGRVHTNFNQTVAATGGFRRPIRTFRTSPSGRTWGGKSGRRSSRARAGCLMAADYVQIELRILASMSGDEALKEAFETGQDIHAAAAARVFGVPLDEVTRDQRRKAKEINYGIPYGVSPWGLAQRLRSSVQEAGALIDQYQKSYSGVSRFLAEQVERARKNGYVETMMGKGVTCRTSGHVTGRSDRSPSAWPSTCPFRGRRPT
jgi:DNA polymerase I